MGQNLEKDEEGFGGVDYMVMITNSKDVGECKRHRSVVSAAESKESWRKSVSKKCLV